MGRSQAKRVKRDRFNSIDRALEILDRRGGGEKSARRHISMSPIPTRAPRCRHMSTLSTPMTETLIRLAPDWIAVWRARIAELGLTHLEVDHLAGLSGGHTSKILCGDRKATGETRDRLCNALALAQGVSIDVEREAMLRAE